MNGTLSGLIIKNHLASDPNILARKQLEESQKQQDKQLRQEWQHNPTTQQTIQLLEQIRDLKIKQSISHNSRQTNQEVMDNAFEAGVLNKTINLLKTGEYTHGS